jgi:hypothetical protein
MATPEGKVKAAVKKELKARDIWYYMPVQNGMGVVGIPDFICCWNGWFLGIETKAPGNRLKLTPNQVNRLNEIEQHKGLAVVVDDIEQLRSLLDNITKMKEGLTDGSQEEDAPQEKSRIIQI